MDKKELWLRLRDYHFDHLVPKGLWNNIQARFSGVDASTKAFANKIATKYKWENGFALRAVWEYKKFVYLGVTSNFNVTPSKVIDQVWHQHILFSRAYRKFCADVIEYEFDHHPELLPFDDQTSIYNTQYGDTLDLYKKEFNQTPPADIWGVPKFDKKEVATAAALENSQTFTYVGIGNYSHQSPLHSSFTESSAAFDFGSGDGGGAGAGSSWSGDADSGESSSGCSSSCGGGGD
jgi:hypothetical protein